MYIPYFIRMVPIVFFFLAKFHLKVHYPSQYEILIWHQKHANTDLNPF